MVQKPGKYVVHGCSLLTSLKSLMKPTDCIFVIMICICFVGVDGWINH